MTGQHRRVLRAIAQCRTAALGGHRDRCDQCAQSALSYNSCRNRHCPKCLTAARNAWVTAREQELLPVGYVHLVFTLPEPLARLALVNKRVVYDLLFRAAAATLLQVAANPKRLGAAIGGLMVLHTWGQRLQHHPHVHCVVPAGGLSPDQTRWIHARPTFFLPVMVLRQVFRGKLVAGLRDGVSRGPALVSGRLQRWPRSPPFARSSDRSFISRGSSTPSRPLAAPPMCCTTSRGTRTASPSPITGSSPSRTTPSPFAGRTIATAVSAHADARRRRIPPPLPAARPTEALRPHPLFWLARASVPHPRARARVVAPAVAPTTTHHRAVARAARVVAVPALWRAHAHRRTPDRASTLPRGAPR